METLVVVMQGLVVLAAMAGLGLFFKPQLVHLARTLSLTFGPARRSAVLDVADSDVLGEA